MRRRTQFLTTTEKTQYLSVSYPRVQTYSTMFDLMTCIGASESLAVRLVLRWAAQADPNVLVLMAEGAQGVMQRFAPRVEEIEQGHHRVARLAAYLNQPIDLITAALSPRPRKQTVVKCTSFEHDVFATKYTKNALKLILPRIVWVAFCLNFPTRQMLCAHVWDEDSIVWREQLQARIAEPDSHEVSDDDLTILAGKRPMDWGSRAIWNERRTAGFNELVGMITAIYQKPVVGPDDVVVPDADEAESGEQGTSSSGASQNPS